MKLLTAAALAAACLAVSGCAGMSPLAVNPKLDPAAQQTQAEAKAYFDKALADRLPYCQITANGKIGVSLSATPGAGSDLAGTIVCNPKPWAAPPDTAQTP